VITIGFVVTGAGVDICVAVLDVVMVEIVVVVVVVAASLGVAAEKNDVERGVYVGGRSSAIRNVGRNSSAVGDASGCTHSEANGSRSCIS
jgi:hypothetical protein